jgi:hypothetical protein
LWQASQTFVVRMWFAFLPVAVVPSWHWMQVPGATFAWSNVAGVQATVEWHASQLAVVAT